MKSGNLNFLEPCGPLQACNGPDLPFNVQPVAQSLYRLSYPAHLVCVTVDNFLVNIPDITICCIL